MSNINFMRTAKIYFIAQWSRKNYGTTINIPEVIISAIEKLSKTTRKARHESVTSWLFVTITEGGPHLECRSRLRQDSAFFFRTRIQTRSQKIVKNRIKSYFSISAVAGVCVVISQAKTWVNYGWIDDCSRSLNRSRILKFEKLPDPNSNILEQERTQSEKVTPATFAP